MQIKLLIAVINYIMVAPANPSWTPVHNCPGILQTAKENSPFFKELKIQKFR